MLAVRAQAALVRSLLDELEDLAPASGSRLGDALAAQTVEELTQLARRMLEAAAAIAPHRVSQIYASPEYRVLSDPEHHTGVR